MDESASQKIADFFMNYRVHKYEKGQVLLTADEQTSRIYQLVSGRVKQYDVSYRGDEIILNVFKPPAFFPMSMAINKSPNPYTYKAETTVEVRQAPAEEVVEFVKANPDVMYDLLSRVYRGTDGLLGRMAQLMSGSARSRLMYELVIEAKRFGTPAGGGSYVIRISEKDLAARAGLTRETVSREVAKLKKENIIEIRTKDILIKDLSLVEAKLT